MARKRTSGPENSGGGQRANLGFEAQLWRAADALRSNMDTAEYKHLVLGLIFLKYISGAFGQQHAKLEAQRDQGADPENPGKYRAQNVFWVPPEARWPNLKADYILANPPFHLSDWAGQRLRDDKRWNLGLPSGGNGNFAWAEHRIHPLAARRMAGAIAPDSSEGNRV